jgi:hypothetical protein
MLSNVPPQVLEGLSQDTLIGIAVGATKSSVFAEATLGLVAKAAGATLSAWNMDDTAKLLLAISKAKAGTESADVNSFYGRAAEAIAGKLETISDTQLIKVVLSLGKITAMREFLEAAAAEAAKRLSKMPPPQLLLMSQGLLPLGGGNASIAKVLDAWAAMPDESKAQLKADQFAKLLQLVAPVSPSHESFWKNVGGHVAAQFEKLSDAGKASLEAAFPEGAGPSFEGKEKLMAVLRKSQKPKEKEKGSKDKDKEKEKERDRSRERRDAGSKREERPRERSRDQRPRSRSRSRRRR